MVTIPWLSVKPAKARGAKTRPNARAASVRSRVEGRRKSEGIPAAILLRVVIVLLGEDGRSRGEVGQVGPLSSTAQLPGGASPPGLILWVERLIILLIEGPRR